jgi:hypothetical protein
VTAGRYAADAALAAIPAAAEGLADRSSAEEQETSLEAIDAPFTEAVGPIEPGCRCRYARSQRYGRNHCHPMTFDVE